MFRTRRSLLIRRFEFPQGLQDRFESIQSSLSIVSPDIASAQETLECWAEGQFGPHAKLVAPAVYWLGVYVPAELLATVTESARAWKKNRSLLKCLVRRLRTGRKVRGISRIKKKMKQIGFHTRRSMRV